MAKICYRFADGTVDEVEVSDEIAAVYAAIVRDDKNASRRERRHCCSIQAMLENGHDVADPDAEIEETLEREARYEAERRRDRFEKMRLMKKRRELKQKLTAKQAQAYFEFTYLKYKKAEIARHMGITEGAVRKLILKAEANLNELLQPASLSVREMRAYSLPLHSFATAKSAIDESEDDEFLCSLTEDSMRSVSFCADERERSESTEERNFRLLKLIFSDGND